MHDRMLTRRQLREQRGWTADLFQYLPPPDQTRENPHSPRAAPIRLYRQSTVEEVEGRECFKTAMESAQKRKSAAEKAMQTKLEKFTAAIAEETPPELPALSRAEIFRRTFEAAAVDYLLAETEGYRCALSEKFRSVEIDDRQLAIDEKILSEIEKQFPFLATECHRRRKAPKKEPRGPASNAGQKE